MNNIASCPGKITADTICLDSPETNDFIDRNFVLTNREYYRAMWTAMLEKAGDIDLEFRHTRDGRSFSCDQFLNEEHIAELRSALSRAQDMQLYGKVLHDESPTAHSYLMEMLKSAALQGYVFRPVTPGGAS